MRISRRRFLADSAACAAAAGMPGFWRQVRAASPKTDERGGKETVLIVVQLTGGNDGLNTVIPFKDPAYAAARPTLKQPAAKLLRVDDELALHPALAGFSLLLQKSQLAIVQGVGYPQPNRSHFTSMDIWHTASVGAEGPYGWLGRASESANSAGGSLYVGGGELPMALNGPANRAKNLRSLEEYQLKVSGEGDDPSRRKLIAGFAETRPADSGNLLDRIRSTARETYQSADRLRQVAQKYDTPVTYPQTGLAQRLKLIAQLIDAGVSERIYYTQLAGFDTHSDQAKMHADLLQELGDALAAFHDDVAHHGHQQRVLTVTFSEFGRRVKENGSQGTDHGAASQLFVAGAPAAAGVIGAHPGLTDLDDGDLKFHTDFRRVYATLLEEWLQVPSQTVLGQPWERVPFLTNKRSMS